MDRDPAVWGKVEELILAKLDRKAGAALAEPSKGPPLTGQSPTLYNREFQLRESIVENP